VGNGRAKLGSTVALGGLLLALSTGATAQAAQHQAEALTISVDRVAREIRGTLVADSTYWHFCWGDGDAHVKIRRVQPGRDKLVGEDPYTDFDRNWKVRFRGTAIKGKRIYAEVPGFDNCAPVRSRIVRAP
jgi:hypothetical protein